MNKRVILRKLFLASILITSATLGGAAQIWSPEIKLMDKVSPQSQANYLDLIKKVFPDAQMDATKAEIARAKNKIPLRNLLIKEPDASFKAKMLGELDVAVTASIETVNGREKLLWLLIGVSDKGEDCDSCGNTILAVYRVGKTGAELIDAASVKTKEIVSFPEISKVPIASQREAVVIYNNERTNIATDSYSIVMLGDKGFDVLLKEFEETAIYKCGAFIAETTSFRPLKASVGGLRRLEVLVKTETGSYGDEETVDQRRTFRYVYNWQPRAQKYVAVINPEKARRTFFNKNKACME